MKEALKLTKRRIRRTQKQKAARVADIHQEIIKTCKEKQNMFYQKINLQRQLLKGPSSITDFAENQKESEEESRVSYFFKLASPSTNECFDQQYQ